MAIKADIKRLNTVEKELLGLVRKFPGIFRNKTAVLSHILLGNGTYCWKDGRLVSETGDSLKQKNEVSADAAYYMLISSTEFFPLPYHVNWAALYHTPENATEEWVREIQVFVHDYLKMSVPEYRLLLRAHIVRHYSYTNPYGKADFVRRMRDFYEVRENMIKLCKSKGKSWDWVYKKPTMKARAKQNSVIDSIIDEILAEEKVSLKGK